MSLSEKLASNLSNRKWLASRLRAEIVGPDPFGQGNDIRSGGEPKRFTREEHYKPKKQANGEEVLRPDSPSKRYGAGVLFPVGVIGESEQLRAGEEDEQQVSLDIDPGENQNVDEKLERHAERKAAKTPAAMDESEDYAVTLANAFRPSAIGLSFLADFSVEGTGLRVEIVSVGRLGNDDLQEIPAGTYKQVKVNVEGSSSLQSVWLRVPLLDDAKKYPCIEISSAELLVSRGAITIRKKLEGVGQGLEIVVVSRGGYSRLTSTQRLITVSLVNRKLDAGNLDEQCLFQAGIRVKGQTGTPWIQPYPETEVSKLGVPDPMSDEQINRLIYRQHQTFAIGHGCAADWAEQSPSTVSEVWTDVMPAFETPTTSADLFVQNEDGSKQPIKVSMRKLAGLDPDDDGSAEIDALVRAYKSWIKELKTERKGVRSISGDMTETAEGLIRAYPVVTPIH